MLTETEFVFRVLDGGCVLGGLSTKSLLSMTICGRGPGSLCSRL
jgi:hypothetical protein